MKFVPWDPFGPVNLGQVIVCGGLLVYLVATWNRARLHVGAWITALMIIWPLVRLPWAAVVWCQLGRPLEAFTVPELAAVTIGLQYPGRWSHGVVAIWLFTLQGLFAFFYARHLGLDQLVPLTEPFGTIAFTLLAFSILFARQRSRELAEQHGRARAEIQTLEHIRPLFVHAREVLAAQVDVLIDAVRPSNTPETAARTLSMGRALERLGELGQTLDGLVTTEDSSPSLVETERALMDHDAQRGAILVSAIAVLVGIGAILTFRGVAGAITIPLLTAVVLVGGVLLTHLLMTRRQPSARRAIACVLALFAITLPVVNFNQYWLLDMGRPYAPFLGHKILMGILGLTMATRFRLGVVLILVTAANAVVLFFALDLGAHTDIVETSEPFPTLIYMLVGLSALRMLERRRMASLQVVRDEAEMSAMQRRTLMFLALRDRLNSPLQTLVLGAAGTIPFIPPSTAERVQVALDSLVDLSRELAVVDMPGPPRAIPASLDVDRQLRRRD